MDERKPVLEMKNISKSFAGKIANDDISLKINQGEIVALLGENGAGKTTLMNILFGLYKPDAGEIYIDGERADIKSPLDAIRLGIGMVHQHFMLVSAFNSYENITLSLAEKKLGRIDSKSIKEMIETTSEKFDLTVHPNLIVEELPVGLQQQVEILKALLGECKLLILDEPTGVLNEQEKQKLFESLKELRASGLSIIFISHKLDEVLEISDRVVILRRGKLVDAVETKYVNKEDLACRMVGRNVVFCVKREDVEHEMKDKKPVLEIRSLCVPGKREASTIRDLDLTVYSGEIFGIAGVDGNGQSELIEAISGLRQVGKGSIRIKGVDVTHACALKRKQAGLGLIPEDRRSMGTVANYNLEQNILMRTYDSDQYKKSFGRINMSELRRVSDRLIEEFDIRIPSRNMPVGQLSGGNIQKVIIAREVSAGPDVLLSMHPTRGLDVGAIEFVHEHLIALLKKGAGIILVSTELEEICGLSDRMVVMSNGKLSGVFRPGDYDLKKIGLLMGGTDEYGEVQ